MTGQGKGTERAERRGATVAPYVFVAPFYILFAVFMAYPLLDSVWTSLHYQRSTQSSVFVGLANYRELLTDWDFWQAVINTAYFTLGSLVLQIPLALGLAVIVNSKLLRGRNIFRLAFFSPTLVAGVFVAIIFRQLYATQSGLINNLLVALGAHTRIGWLEKPALIMPAIVLMGVWKSMGFNMLYFLAGLQGIRQELYEAAEVDGANRWQSFRHVTIPSLRPILTFVIIMSVIGSLQLFDMPYVLCGEGPGGWARTIVMYLYRNFESSELGLACATGWSLAVMIFLVTLAQLRMLRAFQEEK
jgi:ABC-type sugar transport system permease subunit